KQVERYSYDDESRLARFELDQDGDGLAEIVRSYSYLEEGEYLFTLVDYGDDGSVDERIRQSYYPSGRVATLAIDAGNKGHFRWLTSYSYHPNGTLATREHQSDDDQDGTIDSIDLETFDETGRPLVNEWDADADGQWDQRLENVYGPHGLTQTTEKTSTSVLRTTTYGYTPNGALESRETRDGTGELQESELRTYDSSSRLQSILTTKNDAILLETGTAQVRQVYHYDGCSSP
ncbi:MAG: hypothetical protein KC609_02010, partial [Myxococcales bacterium]|nr:hypothetical protein [Myxococcales bacterium]